MAETYQNGFAEVNGTRLAYEVAGTGHPLILIHGGLVHRRLWDEQFPVFAQHYRVIRFDIRGFGDSAPSETPPYFFEEDIHSLLRFLGVEKTQFDLPTLFTDRYIHLSGLLLKYLSRHEMYRFEHKKRTNVC
ncbi:alpha/beta fold hydrolase [Tengunoibacter tsumagoiensis]|uniref:AB hydrolase-1 domain-containing protein n=1 Tax=Tengunoibacter tsumagoiensis TaxID=2014871 RepID=A0A402A937_9CHLR|nr:alpha/beta hydrolase [Tengunoibacter tsumagoiensis]GCE15639.1 hypothetical protein KTT_54980 [Tengunoibacter tsumagoiensis]